VQGFADVNPGLDETMISVQCHDGSELEEVRICVDKDNLSVKACGGRVRSSCRYGKLKIPVTR
jgi:ribonuclease I